MEVPILAALMLVFWRPSSELLLLPCESPGPDIMDGAMALLADSSEVWLI